MSKDKPEFGDIPPKYQRVIHKTLEDDLLIQRGRAKDLTPLTDIQKLSEKAYQRAQNTVTAEMTERREAEAAQNRQT